MSAAPWNHLCELPIAAAVGSILHSPVKQNASIWHELIKIVEIGGIARHHGPSVFATLQVDEGVIETFSFGACLIAAKAKHKTAQNSSLAPNHSIRCHETMCGNVANRPTDCFERFLCSRVIRLQPAERIGKFGDTNRGVVARSHGNKGIKRLRRPTVKDVDVYSRIKQDRPAYCRGRLNPIQPLFWSAAKRTSLPVRLEPSQDSVEIKTQCPRLSTTFPY